MDQSINQSKNIKVVKRHPAIKSFQRHWQLYILMILPVLYFIIFKYVPMLGAVIAFKDYNVVQVY